MWGGIGVWGGGGAGVLVWTCGPVCFVWVWVLVGGCVGGDAVNCVIYAVQMEEVWCVWATASR